MSEKHKNVCRVLNYFEHFLAFVSAMSGCVSVSAFASLVGVCGSIASSAEGWKICTLTTVVKKYSSIIMKKRKKHNKIVLLVKTKSNAVEVLIAKALKKSCSYHDIFFSW